MPYTHYPKLNNNIVLAWVQPAPPAQPGFLGQPSFGSVNRFTVPLGPGEVFTGYQEAQPFTRFYGSMVSDCLIEVVFSFSNDEVGPDGGWVTDATLPFLNYDAEGLRQQHDPKKPGASSRAFVTIYGRWLRVEIKNLGDRVTTMLRVIIRGSVF